MTDRLAGSTRLGRSFGWTLLPLGAILALLVLSPAGAAPQEPSPPAATHGNPATAQLAKRFRDWLEAAAAFITGAERMAFLALTCDYQRDAFIERFWRERDPFAATARNELL